MSNNNFYVDALVRREVMHNLCQLMSCVSKEGAADVFGISEDEIIDMFGSDDWEEPARENGWVIEDGQIYKENTIDGDCDYANNWQEACEFSEIDEPYRNDVFEHWAVTDWFGDKLKEKGEIVFDFLDFTVWGRTCTGQAVSMDYVVQQIFEDLNK